MKKIVKTSIFGIETFVSGLKLPDVLDASLELLPMPQIEGKASVYRLIELANNSPFHLCKFITLRNDFDLLSGEQYFGELKLNFVDYDGIDWKLITVAHGRLRELKVLST